MLGEMMHTWRAYYDGKPVKIKTNLDLAECEDFSMPFMCIPRIGDALESNHAWRGEIHLDLQVVDVTHNERGITLELHLRKRFKSISEFYEAFYQPISGRRFI